MIGARIQGLAHQLQAGQTLKQNRYSGAHFQPGQRCADAEMHARPKSDVGFDRACRIKAIGFLPAIRVAVGTGEYTGNFFAGVDYAGADFDFLISPSLKHLHRGVKTQDFLDRGVDVFAGKLVRRKAGLQNCRYAVADAVDCCFVACVQK